MSVRAASAAGLSLVVATYVGLPFPVYSMITAVIVSDLAPAETRRLAVPRLAGTVVGATLGAALIAVTAPRPAAVALGILIAMLVMMLARRPDAAKLAGFVCGIVLLHERDHPWSYAAYRLLETTLGIGMAIAVSLVPKLIRVEPREAGHA